MQLTKFHKLRKIYTKKKESFRSGFVKPSIYSKRTATESIETQTFTREVHFAVLTRHNKIKPVQYLDKLKNVSPPQKDDCHPILPDFGNDQFSNPINDKGENSDIKPPESIFFEAVKRFESQNKNQSRKYQNIITTICKFD